MEFRVDGRMGGAILPQAPPDPTMNKKNEIQLLRVNYLRGPNLWTYRPALETWLDLGELEDHPSHELPGLNDRLCAWLPALAEHHCGVGERGGFLQRLTKAPGAATCSSTWSSSCSTWRACPPDSARRAAPTGAASTAWSSAPATSRSRAWR
jgi:hypothetical protein